MNKVDAIFTNIAVYYDLMNNVISLGSHGLLKNIAVSMLKIEANDVVLDLACGTGDLGKKIIEKYKPVKVVLADMNKEMLKIAKSRVSDLETQFISCIAEDLPFANSKFDKIIIGFGIRNFSDLHKSLLEIQRVLKPGGKFVVIEFSQPVNKMIRIFRNLYFKKIIPLISKLLIKKVSEYKYLSQSIINFANQRKVVGMLEETGFINCHYKNYFKGIIAIHYCTK